MSVKRSVAFVLSALLVLTACASDGGTSDSSGGGTSSAASCALMVTIDGEPWEGIPLAKPLDRPTVDTEIEAVLPDCDDVGGDGQQAGPGRKVTLKPIQGLPPDQVLFLPGEDLDNQVFVPQLGPQATIRSLPARVQELLREQ